MNLCQRRNVAMVNGPVLIIRTLTTWPDNTNMVILHGERRFLSDNY